jgi:hypothetical protein
MTTTRIDHTGHNHPSTTAARTACRKAMKKVATVARGTIGSSRVVHMLEVNMSDVAYDVRCGKDIARVARVDDGPVDTVTCKSCRAKYGHAHG